MDKKLMELGRQVIRAEQLFGKDSAQHKRAVAAWRKRQQRLGITRVAKAESQEG